MHSLIRNRKVERRIERKETRRHVSLEGLEEYGVSLEARNSDPFEILMSKEEEREEISLLAGLSKKQCEVITRYVFERKSKSEIADELGVDESAIRQRIKGEHCCFGLKDRHK